MSDPRLDFLHLDVHPVIEMADLIRARHPLPRWSETVREGA